MPTSLVEINLYGTCIVRGAGEHAFEIKSSKHRALFVLLATAPFGRRTRTYLQDILWGTACYDGGRQSLRRALSDIKKAMGPVFNAVISASASEITLDLDRVAFIGEPGKAEFLEGIDIQEEEFESWLRAARTKPEQFFGLFGPTRRAPIHKSQPVIAIIPFTAIQEGPKEDVVADWLAQEVSRTLSRSNLLMVISHLSTRRFTTRTLDLHGVRQKLDADYCLAGSIRCDAGNVIVDADFCDTASGGILWTRRFVQPVDQIVALDNPLIDELVRSIGRSIVDDSIRHVADLSIGEIDNHRLLVAAVGLMQRLTLQGFSRSRALLEECIARTPMAAAPHAWLGKWHVLSVVNGWSSNEIQDARSARDCVGRALDRNPEHAFAHTIDGYVTTHFDRRPEDAIARYDQALSVNPNEALAWLLKGAAAAFCNDGETAVVCTEHARNLSPLDPFTALYDSISATAYATSGDFERAALHARLAIDANDRELSALRVQILALHQLGRDQQELKAAAKLLLQRAPGLTVGHYLATHAAGKQAPGLAVADALRSAGIPE